MPATPEYAYQYDDIGNRITSTDLGINRTYTANSLNQYSAITTSDFGLQTSSFEPQFDDDGNQTLIQTSTGVWSVQYNGENRPVLWTGGIPSAMTNIVMSFDRMGRRVHYLENCGMVTNTDYVFTYDSYHCIARHRKRFGGVTLSNLFTWHSVDLISFSPLVVCGDDMPLQYYTYDGRNNVSELVFSGNGTDVSTHYDYVSAVGVSAKRGISSATNPWRFSSEYADDTIGCVYYNYRHFDPGTGRWMTFDALEDLIGPTRYLFLKNKMYSVDYLGLYEEFSHFYMIAWLAHQHLQDPMDAKALAYGSQYPDTEDWDPIRNVLADDKIYRPISQLHNLNGFNRGEVEIYRCCVLEHCTSCMDEAQQIADGKKRHLKLFECGVFLHTLGDTYAHTKSGDVSRDKDAGSAYLPRIGHFFDGKSPDNPSKDLDKYSDFIDDVNSIFTTRDVKVGELARLRILDEIMREQANNSWWRFWEDSDYKRAIKRLVEEEYQFDYNKNEELLSKGPRPSSDGGNSLRDNLNGIITGKVLPKLDECYRELGK